VKQEIGTVDQPACLDAVPGCTRQTTISPLERHCNLIGGSAGYSTLQAPKRYSFQEGANRKKLPLLAINLAIRKHTPFLERGAARRAT
jgi:hypothetical protein